MRARPWGPLGTVAQASGRVTRSECHDWGRIARNGALLGALRGGALRQSRRLVKGSFLKHPKQTVLEAPMEGDRGAVGVRLPCGGCRSAGGGGGDRSEGGSKGRQEERKQAAEGNTDHAIQFCPYHVPRQASRPTSSA